MRALERRSAQAHKNQEFNMPPTPPPRKTTEEVRTLKPKAWVRLTRVLISFLLGGLALLVLLVVSGNKTVSEVVEMLQGLFQ